MNEYAAPPERTMVRRDDLGLETPFAQPAEGMETISATMFAKVLAVDVVGMDDDYFDLGGDSLTAEQIVFAISAELNIDIPVSSLFDNSTPRRFTAYVQETLSKAPVTNSSEVDLRFPPLNHPVPGKPVYAIHAYQEHLSQFFELAVELDRRRHLIGIRPNEPVEARSHHVSIREQGRRIADALITREKQPKVLNLIGYSYGAWITCEIARHLVGCGWPAPKTLLLDPSAPWLKDYSFPHRLWRLRHEWGRAEAADAALRMKQALCGDPMEFLHHRDIRRFRPPTFDGFHPNIWFSEKCAPDGRLKAWTKYYGARTTTAVVPGDHNSLLRGQNVEKLAADVHRLFD